MKTSPVSFGSLMCFTLKNNKPKAPVTDMVKMAFMCNEKLANYDINEDVLVHDEKVKGYVHNAAADFCDVLDLKYRSQLLPKGSNKVVLTEADFYVNSKDTEKKYFITAPTPKDEDIILRALSVSNDFYTVRLGRK